MRRLRSSAVRRLFVCCLLSLGLSQTARAQSGSSNEGAADLLLPTGARSMGMGQAVAAAAIGSDALWWNPALIARGPREVGLHLSTGPVLLQTDAGGAIILPVNRLGAFALSFRYVNNGTQARTDSNGVQTGTFSTGSSVIAATFAAIITDRIDGGVTYKIFRLNAGATGAIDQAGNVPQTPALDLGIRFRVTSDSSLSVGASIRNIGLKLQVNDTPQSDALPARADFGLLYVPKIPQLPKEAKVRIASDMVTYVVGGTSPGFRIGGELSWMDRYQARVGYVATGPTGSGPTFGVGLSTGKLRIDFAQFLSDQSATGSTPTFLSLRYIF